MTTFVEAVADQEARTANNMKARKSTANACVDLFYNIGALRGKDPLPGFVAAFVEDKELATRIALWARDARGGAGERQIFRTILQYLDKTDPEFAARILHKVPELGRWDDLLVFVRNQTKAFAIIKEALIAGHGLAAKWMPRNGRMGAALRDYLRMSPKKYRKFLVSLTNVVEQQMCARKWDEINYSHVPSLASSRYMKAFLRHDKDRYTAWKEGLKKGETTVHAGVLYPYDVLKTIRHGDEDVSMAQWEALPNYMGEASVLPIVDASGSMGGARVGGNKNLSCLDVALSLGLYCADKNSGRFKDTFLTFSGEPQLVTLRGNLIDKIHQIDSSAWGMNTNLHAAFKKILDVATKNRVPQGEMPGSLLILSDMQFDECAEWDDSAIEMIRRKYENAGYTIPRVVFWNLNASYGNVPVRHNEKGVALVSGFSPAIMTSILGGKDFTPEGIMLEAVMKDRYSLS